MFLFLLLFLSARAPVSTADADALLYLRKIVGFVKVKVNVVGFVKVKVNVVGFVKVKVIVGFVIVKIPNVPVIDNIPDIFFLHLAKRFVFETAVFLICEEAFGGCAIIFRGTPEIKPPQIH